MKPASLRGDVQLGWLFVTLSSEMGEMRWRVVAGHKQFWSKAILFWVKYGVFEGQ